MSTLNVWYSTDELAHLSNLAYRPFHLRGADFISVEHAYQSLKSGKFDAETYAKYTKAGVKHVGKKGTKIEGDYNLRLMLYLMRLSFNANPYSKHKLLETSGHKLTHVQDRGIWRDVFPKFLMQIREEIS